MKTSGLFPRRPTLEKHMTAKARSSSSWPGVRTGRGVLYTPRSSRIGPCRYALKWSAKVYDIKVGLLRSLQEQYGTILPDPGVRRGCWAQRQFVLELEDGERIPLVADDESNGAGAGWLSVKRTT